VNAAMPRYAVAASLARDDPLGWRARLAPSTRWRLVCRGRRGERVEPDDPLAWAAGTRWRGGGGGGAHEEDEGALLLDRRWSHRAAVTPLVVERHDPDAPRHR